MNPFAQNNAKAEKGTSSHDFYTFEAERGWEGRKMTTREYDLVQQKILKGESMRHVQKTLERNDI